MKDCGTEHLMRVVICPKCDYRWKEATPSMSLPPFPRLPGEKDKPIFSGDYSVDMWQRINKARTIRDCSDAMYLICCRLQELESRLRR